MQLVKEKQARQAAAAAGTASRLESAPTPGASGPDPGGLIQRIASDGAEDRSLRARTWLCFTA